MDPTTAAETTSTQLFGILYITLTGLLNSMVPKSGPWSLLGQSVPYTIKLEPSYGGHYPLARQYPALNYLMLLYSWLAEIMTIFYKHGNLGLKMFLNKNRPAKELKDPALGTEPQNPATSQVQNVVVNQTPTKVDMPQIDKIILEEALQAIIVL
ncbi:hypothetical protein DSO57_1038174 [Entomophthora muscae]|uniref:Uncharacterized protein n=1 Tax=Entomophthora muscae TaxID=34485 RepID=A0ACC2TXA8_9FUNG|nr:hypothetical protein DSO57_1038174 [Entomophthora muscae]